MRVLRRKSARYEGSINRYVSPAGRVTYISALTRNPRLALLRIISGYRGLAIDHAKSARVEEDWHLMERVGNRDISAFDALYEKHHRLVYGIGVRILGDATAAEDLMQAVFLKIWNSPEAFHGGSLRAWLTRVARNRAIDFLRRRRTQTIDEIGVDTPDANALEDTVFSRLNAQSIRTALQALPSDQRIAIEMGFFEGLTHTAVAERLNTPLGTVKTRIRSGLRRLRSALEETVSQ